MAKVFDRFTLVLTIAVVMTLFVSENIRLFGWVLTLMKGGLIEGYWRYFTGEGFDGPLYNVADHHLRAGLCLSAFHAVPAGAGHRHGARRRPAGGL